MSKANIANITLTIVFGAAGLAVTIVLNTQKNIEEFASLESLFTQYRGWIIFVGVLILASLISLFIQIWTIARLDGRKKDYRKNKRIVYIFLLLAMMILIAIVIYMTYSAAKLISDYNLKTEIERIQGEYDDMHESFFDLKKITLSIEDLKYFDLKGNYIIQFPNYNWAIDYKYSDLDRMIFYNKVRKDYIKVRVYRFENLNYIDSIDFTEQRYPDMNDENGKILDDNVQFFTLSEIEEDTVDNITASVIEFNAYRDEKYGHSKPYYSHGESYQILHLEEDGIIPYVIITECFGNKPDYSDAIDLFLSYKYCSSRYGFRFIVGTFTFSSLVNYKNGFTKEFILKSNGWGIAISSDDTLEVALDKAKIAERFGYDTIMYFKNDRYDTFIGPYIYYDDLEKDLSNIKSNLFDSACIAYLADYCPKYIQREGYREYVED